MPDAVADSSPAATDTLPVAETVAEQAIVSGDVAAYRSARQAERAGKPLSSPADSTPAAPAVQAASTDASSAPASEPGTSPTKRNADTRIQELLTERHTSKERITALEREIETLRRPPVPDAPAASSPATATGDAFPEHADWIAKPGHETRSYEDYLDARADHRAEIRQRERQRETDQQQARQAAETVTRGYQDRLDTFRTDHADFDDVIAPILTWASPNAAALVEAIQRSEAGPALAYALGQDQAACKRLLGLPPVVALVELGKLEAKLTTAPPPGKPITEAPTPPTTLGRRAADPTDEADAAVAAGDVVAFRAARLKQRVAATR